MDLVNGAFCRWRVVYSLGNILLFCRLQRSPFKPYVAQGLWYELHSGVYAHADCKFPRRGQLIVLRSGAVYGRLVQCSYYSLAGRYNLPHTLCNVSQEDIFEGVRGILQIKIRCPILISRNNIGIMFFIMFSKSVCSRLCWSSF